MSVASSFFLVCGPALMNTEFSENFFGCKTYDIKDRDE